MHREDSLRTYIGASLWLVNGRSGSQARVSQPLGRLLGIPARLLFHTDTPQPFLRSPPASAAVWRSECLLASQQGQSNVRMRARLVTPSNMANRRFQETGHRRHDLLDLHKASRSTHPV
ncbi:hypothetical protein KTR9_4905 (plasmid) [Gordonia sp. KTR9]|nr:hypothetical protein KTR9_4905 [Gordonia sp. KTR9]